MSKSIDVGFLTISGLDIVDKVDVSGNFWWGITTCELKIMTLTTGNVYNVIWTCSSWENFGKVYGSSILTL